MWLGGRFSGPRQVTLFDSAAHASADYAKG